MSQTEQKLYWNSKAELLGIAKYGDPLPDGFKDPRLERWKKNGTVSESEPDTSAQKQKELDLKDDELQSLKDEVSKLKQFQKDYAKSEEENEKLLKKNKDLEERIAKVQNKFTKFKDVVVSKLEQDSLKKSEKEELIKLAGGE